MAIKFSTNYEPPQEGEGMYNGYEMYSGGLDRAAYGAFYGGYPDDPRAGMSLLRSVSGFGQADEGPSRATWFLLGVGAVLAWPTVSRLLSRVK